MKNIASFLFCCCLTYSVTAMDQAPSPMVIPASKRRWNDARWNEVRTLAMLHAERSSRATASETPGVRTYFANVPRELTDLIIKKYIGTNVSDFKEFREFKEKSHVSRKKPLPPWRTLLKNSIYYVSGKPNQNHYVVDFMEEKWCQANQEEKSESDFAHAVFMGDVSSVELHVQQAELHGKLGELLSSSLRDVPLPYGLAITHYCEDDGKPLELATRCGHRPLVELFLAYRKKVDPQRLSPWGLKFPLLYAASLGRADLLQLLLSHHTSNKPWFSVGYFVWNAALRKGDYECVQLLLDEYFGNYPEEIKREACTSVLYAAAERGCLSLVQLSVEQGAEVNKSYSYAAKPKGGATSYNKQASTWIYLTALDKAIRACHKNCAAFLLSKGGTIANQDTPREGLLNAASKGDVDFIRFLQERRAPVLNLEHVKQEALQRAEKNGYRDLVEPVLMQWADSTTTS